MAFREGKSRARLLTIISFGVVLFMVADYAFDGALRSQVRTYTEPVITMSYRVGGFVFQTDFWKSRAALQREVERLSMEVEREKGVFAAIEAVRDENEILRSLARVAENTPGTTVPVVSSFSSSPYGTFMIGAGSVHGISVGDLALASDGFVLGSVTDVAENSSVVGAVFSPGVSTDVMTDNVAFSVIGRGGGNARAEVPRELPLAVGEPILAPQYASRPVGIIGRIESASSSAFSDVFVLFPYNINTIRFVFVTPR